MIGDDSHGSRIYVTATFQYLYPIKDYKLGSIS